MYEIRGNGDAVPALHNTKPWSNGKRRWIRGLAKRIFLPEQVVDAYYRYSAWRALQRLLSATVNVFGLQAMIMAVGARNGLGTAAAIDWVLKDALGKCTRLAWAGKMGRAFDGDAKRWRFRSSVLYASGNGLQIATFACPSLFLLLATIANCFKQVSLLTSTATRSAIYRSFAATDDTNNIGDITAKGEAQIAVVDLLGMAIGIAITKACAFDKARLLFLYVALSFAEILAMYNEIRAVVFKQLNLDRALDLLRAFVVKHSIPTPSDLARRERILLGPRDSNIFPPLSTVVHDEIHLANLVDIFANDDFLLAPREKGAVIVLTPDAPDLTILRALLARAFYDRHDDPDVYARLRTARDNADTHFDSLLADMEAVGWSTTSFMFPEIRIRASWPRPSVVR